MNQNHARKMKFGLVGIASLIVSYASLYALIHGAHWNPSAAYAVQTVLAIETNFLLNYYFTWRDRAGGFWPTFAKFHVARVGLMIPINQALFAVAEHFTNFWAANTICVAASMVVNWFLNDRWTFKTSPAPDHVSALVPLGQDPFASIVVPVRNSAATIGECVASLLAQDYQNLEVIVVGDSLDSSWAILSPMAAADARLRLIGVELDRGQGTRDANAKRLIGLQVAHGQVIAMTDSDMILDEHWLGHGIAMLLTGHDGIASGMISKAAGFLGGYIDHNRVGGSTPDLGHSYTLTRATYGKSGFKPPVTANLILRRELYDATGGPDPAFTNSYEDYEWARRIIDAGFAIFYTPALSGQHHHRATLRQMIRDYRRSGRGCADYIRKHPTCRLAQNRLSQAAMIPLAVVTAVAGGITHPWITATLAVLGGVILTVTSAVRSRSVIGGIYPAVTLTLGLAFWWGIVSTLITPPTITAPIILDVDHAPAASNA